MHWDMYWVFLRMNRVMICILLGFRLEQIWFRKAEDWTNYLKDYAEKVRNPLVVTVQK